MPDVPPPEAFSPEKMAGSSAAAERAAIREAFFESDRPFRRRPVEMRPVEFERYLGARRPGGRINFWIRANAELPDDPTIHQCALAYASDMALLDSIAARHGRALFEENIMAASLDHAMWFHRPFRADEWMLYSQDSPSANGGRGLARGHDLHPRRRPRGDGGAGRPDPAAHPAADLPPQRLTGRSKTCGQPNKRAACTLNSCAVCR